MFKTGYILNWRADLIWFLALPFLAVAAGLASQEWLAPVVIASVSLWITFPHHYASWLRAYGLSEDWRRFRDQLIAGPLIIMTMTLFGLWWAPLTLVAVAVLWDHQHSLMQQHGFARIYDFKAGTGSPSTPRWDLALNWVLYGNLFLTAPLFTFFWIREAFRLELIISSDAVRMIQTVSWSATGVFLFAYLAHLLWSVGRGYRLNPVKYAFIAASYFLWYFCAWNMASVLVYAVAHRLMHGLQYIVMVYWYLRRKTSQSGAKDRLVSALVRPGNVLVFVGTCIAYAVVYQLIANRPLDEFGFGVISFMKPYATPVPEHGLDAMSSRTAFELFALVLIESVGMVHYYLDSFIWKVRDKSVRKGL